MIAGVIILHIWALHIPGSSNPTGIEVKDEQDTVPFHPYYTAKDGFGLGAVSYTHLDVYKRQLQTGSYFASWRLGFSDGQENVGGALSYGLVAALPVLLFTAAILFVIGIIGFLLFGGAFAPALLSGRQPSESALAGMGFAMLILVPLFLLLSLIHI